MRRRTALAFGGALLACPVLGRSQAAKQFRVGWLHSGKLKAAGRLLDAFVAGMRERGHVLGESFVVDIRAAEGDPRRFAALARELVALRPDVLLGYETSARAMAAETSTIPIVLATSIDPVAAGLVKSLARSGTNVTGMVDQFDQLIAKHVELLVELAPKASRIAFLNDRFWSARDSYERFARMAAASKGLEVTMASVGDAADLQRVFAAFEKARPDGMIVAATAGAMALLLREIVDGARRMRLPAVYPVAFFPEGGGLLSYGPNLVENFREAADFVARIFRGEKPADLPLRQTKKFYLLVNLKAASEIGVTIPRAILLRADRVIE